MYIVFHSKTTNALGILWLLPLQPSRKYIDTLFYFYNIILYYYVYIVYRRIAYGTNSDVYYSLLTVHKS